MLDYRAWVERAVEFTKRLGSLPGDIHFTAELRPPMNPKEVEALSDRLRIPLPEPLRVFLTHASSSCRCEYSWEPTADFRGRLLELFPSSTFIFGGASLCDSDWFEEHEGGCFDMATAYEATQPDEARVWANSVPFHPVGNGDYFALCVGGESPNDELPVIYLDHEGNAAKQLARSFDEFLTAWEQLSYIGGFFLIDYFLDPFRGMINLASPKKAALDELFRAGKVNGP